MFDRHLSLNAWTTHGGVACVFHDFCWMHGRCKADAWSILGILHAFSMHSAGGFPMHGKCMADAWIHSRHIACIFHAFCWCLPMPGRCMADAWRMHGGRMADLPMPGRRMADLQMPGGRMANAWGTHGGRMVDHLNYVIFEPKSIALGIPSRFITWQNYAFYNVTELHISQVSKWQSLVTARIWLQASEVAQRNFL